MRFSYTEDAEGAVLTCECGCVMRMEAQGESDAPRSVWHVCRESTTREGEPPKSVKAVQITTVRKSPSAQRTGTLHPEHRRRTMGYTIAAGETRPLVDPLSGDPLATAGVTDPSGTPPPFATGMAASISDSGGFLVCTGNSVGSITFDLKKSGTIASHTVTVTSGDFDWTLGDPV